MSVPVSVICSYMNWVINSALFLIFKFSYFFLFGHFISFASGFGL